VFKFKSGRVVVMVGYVRWMVKRDLVDVLRIEKGSFEFSWCMRDFVGCFGCRDCVCLVVEVGGRVVGYMIYEDVGGVFRILNIAVCSCFRRQGFGGVLVGKLVEKLGYRGSRVVLEVRESNLGAQLFFRSCGFRAVEVLNDFYSDVDEDAYLMEYNISCSCVEI